MATVTGKPVVFRCRRDTCEAVVKDDGDACWKHEYDPLVAHHADRCPWCEGTGRYATIWIHINATWIPCGYCKGTGLAEVWTTHPDYARTQAITSKPAPRADDFSVTERPAKAPAARRARPPHLDQGERGT